MSPGGTVRARPAAAYAVAVPGSVDDVMRAVSLLPEATLVAGGTEIMTQVNAGTLSPRAFVMLDRIEELRGVWFAGDEVIIGAATSCAALTHADSREVLPALAQAARTIGGPGLRSRATLGGNLLSGKLSGGPTAAAPGRDLLPVLIALKAVAVCLSATGWRQIPVAELYARDGGLDLRPGELLTALRVPITGGPQGFMKVGTRNAAARPVVTFALAVDLDHQTVTCAIGGFSPAAVRVDHAGQWLAGRVDWSSGAIPDPQTYPTFARLVAEGLMVPQTAGPAGLSTAAVSERFRRSAVEVCARRALLRALPPAGWLEQVAAYQQRAQFVRHRAAVDRAERGLPQEPPVPQGAPGPRLTIEPMTGPPTTAPARQQAARQQPAGQQAPRQQPARRQQPRREQPETPGPPARDPRPQPFPGGLPDGPWTPAGPWTPETERPEDGPRPGAQPRPANRPRPDGSGRPNRGARP